MIDVALLGVIRRWHLRDHVSLREISKRLGMSRNTVRRYLRAETIEPAYADRRSPTSLDKYAPGRTLSQVVEDGSISEG